MARFRQKRLRLGLSSGVIAFCAGWAAVALIATESISGAPWWQGTLWMYLGANFVRLDLTQGMLGTRRYVQPVDATGLPDFVYLLPVLFVGLASAYVCYNLTTTRLKYNVSNAMTTGTSYFFTALVAMVVSDIQPGLTAILGIALLLGGGLWIGSNIIGILGQGIPFFGVASLGGVIALGALVLLGGLAVLSAVLGLVVVTYVPAVLVGAGFSLSRQLKRKGRRSDYPRIAGLRKMIEESWIEVIVVGMVLVALAVGLTRSI